MSEPTVHSFPASRAFDWLSAGWRSFKAAPQTWLIATAVAIGISVLLGFVPKLGQLLANFASLFFFGGLLLIARDLEAGEKPPIARVFAVFQSHMVPVLLTTLSMTLVLGMLVFLVVIFAGGTAVVGGLMSGAGKQAGGFASAALVLVGVLAIAAVSSAMWFAPGLVVLRNVGAWDSIKQSVQGWLRNWSAMLLLSVIFLGLAIVASIPFGLGWLVLTPVLSAASYASIKDVFGE